MSRLISENACVSQLNTVPVVVPRVIVFVAPKKRPGMSTISTPIRLSFTCLEFQFDSTSSVCSCLPSPVAPIFSFFSAQELTRRGIALTFTLSRQGIEARVFAFDFRLSNH